MISWLLQAALCCEMRKTINQFYTKAQQATKCICWSGRVRSTETCCLFVQHLAKQKRA
jgi:hypothetical protein